MPHHDTTPSPLGWIMALGGGLVAQVSPSTPVGAAGLIASIAGLLMAGFQYYKTWMDGKNHVKQIQTLSKELQEAREGRHADANRFEKMIRATEVRLLDSNLKIANLEGRLGITDKTHARAINASSDNINALAEHTGTDLPAPSPHLPANGNGNRNPEETPR
jgi:hypothetical protein